MAVLSILASDASANNQWKKDKKGKAWGGAPETGKGKPGTRLSHQIVLSHPNHLLYPSNSKFLCKPWFHGILSRFAFSALFGQL